MWLESAKEVLLNHEVINCWVDSMCVTAEKILIKDVGLMGLSALGR